MAPESRGQQRSRSTRKSGSRSSSTSSSTSATPHSHLLPRWPSSFLSDSQSRSNSSEEIPSLLDPHRNASSSTTRTITPHSAEMPDASQGISSSTSPNLSVGALSPSGHQSLRSRILSPRKGDISAEDNDKTPKPLGAQMSGAEKQFYPSRGWIRSDGGEENDKPVVGKANTGFDARGYPARSGSSPFIGGLGKRSLPATPQLNGTSKSLQASGTGSVSSSTPRTFASTNSTTSTNALYPYLPSNSSSPQIDVAIEETFDCTYPPAGPSSSRISLAPSYKTYDNPGTANHSPNPSFDSTTAFAKQRSRDDRYNEEYLDEEMSIGSYTSGAEDDEDEGEDDLHNFRWKKRALKNPTLASLDSRLTMGREANEPGFEGLGGQYSLPLDLSTWSALGPEQDDDLHDPAKPSKTSHTPGVRGVLNVGCMAVMIGALLTLFGGYPIISSRFSKPLMDSPSFNMGGSGSNQTIVRDGPTFGHYTQVDPDTPESAKKFTSMEDGSEWELVFSDEFNTPGRTFYPGDDPYWEASNLHYWQTNNLEWYDPKAITTANGNLEITLSNIPTHGLNYQGGMLTSWNKFCFTGGYLEVNVSLPGSSNVYGLWPAVWTLGNLGRAGYGGTLDGLWPYSYNECDVGTLPNQTLNGLPEAALSGGDGGFGGVLSYLPGQRLSRCTCSSDPTHPGPTNPDGSFVGRASPEIDVFEAQWAPFNAFYNFINNSNTYTVYDDTMTAINGYLGGVYQQATSALSITNQNCYTANSSCFSKYGFEYAPGDTGYITWVSDAKEAWTIRGAAMGPNAAVEVGQRPISEEPMYVILNLGISENFGLIDYIGLYHQFPVKMLVDYVRIYQNPNAINVGCNPPDRPTASYIARYSEAYNNPNITTWDQASGGAAKPKNRLVDTC